VRKEWNTKENKGKLLDLEAEMRTEVVAGILVGTGEVMPMEETVQQLVSN